MSIIRTWRNKEYNLRPKPHAYDDIEVRVMLLVS